MGNFNSLGDAMVDEPHYSRVAGRYLFENDSQLFLSESCYGFKAAPQFDTLREAGGHTIKAVPRPPDCLAVGFVPLIALCLTCERPTAFVLKRVGVAGFMSSHLFIAINFLLQQLTTTI